jgi:hypothetical protein
MLMTYARGQASRSLLNREYPHHVLVPADAMRGRLQDEVHTFHDNRSVPMKTHTIRQDDEWYVVFCFADLQTAKEFQLLFGGKAVTNKTL